MTEPLAEKKRVQFVPHEDDEVYDEVRVRCLERWKESELSGDEYRFSYVVEFMRKGQVAKTRGFSRLVWALAHVPAIHLADPSDSDEPCDAFENRPAYCFQPGCPEPATREFRLLQLYAKGSGAHEYMAADTDYRVRYCGKHGRGRGDCGLQDADANLVEVEFGAAEGAPALDPT